MLSANAVEDRVRSKRQPQLLGALLQGVLTGQSGIAGIPGYGNVI